MPTIRAEFHRLRAGTATASRQEVGSSVWQVFSGTGWVQVGAHRWNVERGDVFVVPSWAALTMRSETGLDLFRFSDTPIFELLHQDRVLVNGRES
jgi:gentisate 1,2-dioxygenase